MNAIPIAIAPTTIIIIVVCFTRDGIIIQRTVINKSGTAVIFQLFAVVGMSCANVASVIIGKTVGEGRLDMVKSYSKTLQMMFLIFGITAGVLMFAFKEVIVGVYAVGPETKKMAINFITIL